MSDPGEYSVNWGGLDDQGKQVPGGVYEIQVTTKGYQP